MHYLADPMAAQTLRDPAPSHGPFQKAACSRGWLIVPRLKATPLSFGLAGFSMEQQMLSTREWTTLGVVLAFLVIIVSIAVSAQDTRAATRISPESGITAADICPN